MRFPYAAGMDRNRLRRWWNPAVFAGWAVTLVAARCAGPPADLWLIFACLAAQVALYFALGVEE